MATQYSNKPIVTNGLVYALDFGNQKSYVSGSNSARSLLFNPTTASISASSLDNQGFLNLGTSNFVETNQGYNLGYTSAYTLILTAEPKGNYGGYGATSIAQGGADNTQRFWSGFSNSQVGIWFLPDTTVSSVQAYIGRQFPIAAGKQHLVLRYSSGSYSLFRNGVLVSPSAGGGLGGLASGGNLSIGSLSGYFSATGSFAQFQVYNRALTSDEIWQNYQLSAQRYGIGTVSAKPYSLDENAFLFLSQSGITDPIITSSINTFVLGLKSASLWDKMIAIYPFVGTGSVGVNLTGSQRWNLKEPTTAFYYTSYNGSWQGSTSGSTPSGSGTYIDTGITPRSYHPNFLNNNAHISILSYDTPISSSILAGTGMTKEVAVSTLAGDYGTPAAAYSVRKVRTAYSGALMDVRRSIDNVTSSIGYVSNGDLDTGSLSTFVNAVGEYSPGSYSGLAAAYSLRKVSSSYTGSAIDVRRSDNITSSIGFDASGNLNTGSLLSFAYTENRLLYSNTLDNAAWSNNFGRLTITTASAIAPDGTNTGTLLSGSYQASPQSLALAQVPIGSTSLRYTSILYVSQSTSDYVYLRPGDNTACVYRFSTGVFTNVGPRVATLASESAANGWIKLTAITPANENYVNYYIGPTDNATSNYGSPVSPGAVYVWGAQLNSGSTALPYIQTTTAATTSSYADTYVSQWYDQSGNARHATQTTGSKQPIIVSSGSLVTLQGKPSIYFDATDDAMSTTTLLNKPYAVFLLAQQQISSYIQRIINSPTRNSLIAITRVQETVAAAGDIASASIGLVNTPYVVSLVNDTTSSQVYSNTVNKTTTLNNNDFGVMTFGALGVYNEPAQAFVSEIIAYTGSSQVASRPFIENNINTYYNVYTSSNAGYVARWYDQSGNNRHATQTNFTYQPLIISSGSLITESTGSKPTIYFENGQPGKYLDFSAFNWNQGLIFDLSRQTAASSVFSGLFASAPASGQGMFFVDAGGSGNNRSMVVTNNGTPVVGYSADSTLNRSVLAAWNKLSGSTPDLFYNGISQSLGGTRTDLSVTGGSINFGWNNRSAGKYQQELIIYTTASSVNREPIQYNINSYFNVFTQSANFSTSSFTIYATTSSISASINNDLQSGIASSGPLGFITVSRTGSNSLTLARNGVTSSFAVPASGALSTNLYLGAINNNGLALGSSPYNISFASVGVGLTNNDLNNYYSLVDKLQFNLGRQRLLDIYPGAYLGFSFRRLTNTYTGSSFIVQRSSDNTTASIGFTPSGDLDTGSLLSFVGSGTGYLFKWFNQVGSIDITYNSSGTMYTVVQNGTLNTINGKPCIVGNNSNVQYRYGDSMSTVLFAGATAISVFINNFPAGANTYGHPLQLRMNGDVNHLPYQNYIYENIGVNTRQSWIQYPGFIYYNTLYSIIGNGTTSKYYVNNVEKLSTAYGSTWTGSAVVFSGETAEIDGRLTEVIAYKSDQTSNRIGIQSNINNYYQVY